MKIYVYSRDPLSDDTASKIKSILETSDCPNESLRATFSNFAEMTDYYIYFDLTHRDFCRVIDYEPRD